MPSWLRPIALQTLTGLSQTLLLRMPCRYSSAHYHTVSEYAHRAAEKRTVVRCTNANPTRGREFT